MTRTVENVLYEDWCTVALVVFFVVDVDGLRVAHVDPVVPVESLGDNLHKN